MLPSDPKERKATPIYSGVVKYFPLALAAVARVSKAGNDQHNPGQPLHWAREKSTDHEDCIMRHLTDHAAGNKVDSDGELHLAKVAWRALAALQTEEEKRLAEKSESSSTKIRYGLWKDTDGLIRVAPWHQHPVIPWFHTFETDREIPTGLYTSEDGELE